MKLTTVVLFSFILVAKYNLEKSNSSNRNLLNSQVSFKLSALKSTNSFKTWSRYKATNFQQGQSYFYYTFSNVFLFLLLGLLLFFNTHVKKLSYIKNYFHSGLSPPPNDRR